MTNDEMRDALSNWAIQFGIRIFTEDGGGFWQLVTADGMAFGDPLESLDCVATLEARLTDEQWHAYSVILGNEYFPNGWQDWRDTRALLSLTAEQRCRALVAALNLSL